MTWANAPLLLLLPVSISEKTYFRKISWSIEAATFVFRIVRSLWNLTVTSVALLPICLSNFKAIRQLKVTLSWLRDFAISYENTYFLIFRRGPGLPLGVRPPWTGDGTRLPSWHLHDQHALHPSEYTCISLWLGFYLTCQRHMVQRPKNYSGHMWKLPHIQWEINGAL